MIILKEWEEVILKIDIKHLNSNMIILKARVNP